MHSNNYTHDKVTNSLEFNLYLYVSRKSNELSSDIMHYIKNEIYNIIYIKSINDGLRLDFLSHIKQNSRFCLSKYDFNN